MSELHTPKVAILASGEGTTAEAFIEATQDGRVAAEVGLVICNRPPDQAGVYARISRLNKQYGLDIETALVSRHQYPDGPSNRGQTLEESAVICRKIADGGYDHVALMGYMLIVKGDLVEEYGHHAGRHTDIHQARMSNTHPGPLPETRDVYGLAAAEKVLELGLAASKHTVHVVGVEVDRGPVIAEHPVEVKPDDTAETLDARTRAVEKAALPYALDRFLAEQTKLRGFLGL